MKILLYIVNFICVNHILTKGFVDDCTRRESTSKIFFFTAVTTLIRLRFKMIIIIIGAITIFTAFLKLYKLKFLHTVRKLELGCTNIWPKHTKTWLNVSISYGCSHCSTKIWFNIAPKF